MNLTELDEISQTDTKTFFVAETEITVNCLISDATTFIGLEDILPTLKGKVIIVPKRFLVAVAP